MLSDEYEIVFESDECYGAIYIRRNDTFEGTVLT